MARETNWAEESAWLKHNQADVVMFCEWCHRFDRNEHCNQFAKGCVPMKLEGIKKHKLSTNAEENVSRMC